MKRVRLAGMLLAVLQLAAPVTLRAGGAPENLLMVVNDASWASKATANLYIDLRGVPPSHVLYLTNVPGRMSMDIHAFRKRILGPVIDAIAARRLAQQIDYVVYAADFPVMIDVAADFRGVALPRNITTKASLTGLTYLYDYVMQTNVNYLSLTPNFYMRVLDAKAYRDQDGSAEAHERWMRDHEEGRRTFTVSPTRGFRNVYGWSVAGDVVPPDQGARYFLSCMLAAMSGRGNSWEEVQAYLKRSVRADGTRPEGTIYFTRTKDVRTVARQWAVPSAVRQLTAAGVHTEAVSAASPFDRPDIMGATLGTPQVAWPDQPRIRPGAFIDNLTSFGGVLTPTHTQTPITEFMRHGAAGASGAVSEPYAVHEKFPSPYLHVHYARGCSLAEAYYQSVAAPYQLLLIGDALCQPWARPPRIVLGDLEERQVVRGKLKLRPGLAADSEAEVGSYELYVNGVRVGVARPGHDLVLDTQTMLDGHYEFTVRAASASLIGESGAVRKSLRVSNHGLAVLLTARQPNLILGETLTVEVSMRDAAAIAVFHNGRQVGQVQGDRGIVSIPSPQLGLGPSRLYAIGRVAQGKAPPAGAVSAPLRVTVAPPSLLKALPRVPLDELMRGFVVQPAEGAAFVVKRLGGENIFRGRAEAAPRNAFRVEAYFQAARSALHQVQLQSPMAVRLSIDGKVLLTNDPGVWRSVPVPLMQGWHRLSIDATGEAPAVIDLKWGVAGSEMASDQHFLCPVARSADSAR